MRYALLLLAFFLSFIAAESFAKCGSNEVCVFVGLSKQLKSSAPSVSSTHAIPMSSFTCPVSGTLVRSVDFAAQRFGAVISVQDGTVVKAAAEGKVIESRYAGDSFGRYVLLEHSEKPRVLTRYGYLASQSVREGERVKKGEEVGKSGKSPSGEPSLYFELSRDGTPTREPDEICRSASTTFVAGAVDCSRFQSNGVSEPWSVISGGRYGASRDYRGGHTGFDFGGKNCGSQVLAVWSGEVLYYKNTGAGYGNQLTIKTKCFNGSERVARYSHLQRFNAQVLEKKFVQAGEVVAYVGNTGGDYPCHLHLDVYSPPFEMRGGKIWGTQLNPEPLIVGGLRGRLA